MKKKEIFIRKSLLVLAAWGFFGLFYPELSLLEDTCRIVYENKAGKEEEIVIEPGSELYYKLLSAKPEEIKIKSRLWEWISSLFD